MSGLSLVLGNEKPENLSRAWQSLSSEKPGEWAFAEFFDHGTVPDAASNNPGSLVLVAAPVGPFVGSKADVPVAIWIVMTNPVEGKEAEFNDWYDNRHIHDAVAIPGFVSGQRYRIVPGSPKERPRWGYVTLYEIELAGAGKSLAEAAARAGGPKMPNPGYLARPIGAPAFRPIVSDTET